MTIDCDKAEKFLAAYADDELHMWLVKLMLEKHIRHCSKCQRALQIQKDVKQLIRTRISMVKAPEKLRDKITHIAAKQD
jgi:anti-sigma factor (TIGR02949 family)